MEQGGNGVWSDARPVAALRELIDLIDRRASGLASHSGLVSRYAAGTAAAMGLGVSRVKRIALAGMVHDIGKVTLPDSILAKPGPLSPGEWELVRGHPEHGAWLLAAAGLQDVAQWVLAHHERVDGLGYPHGLAGEEIPLEGRILAVVDAYEAMTANRVYSHPLAPAQASAELHRCAGAQFDETVVDAFLTQVERAAAAAA